MNHVVRLRDDYVEYTRTGGPLGGGVIPLAVRPREEEPPKEGEIRVVVPGFGFVDRPMYTEYYIAGMNYIPPALDPRPRGS